MNELLYIMKHVRLLCFQIGCQLPIVHSQFGMVCSLHLCSVRDLQNWKKVVQQVVEKDRAVLQNWKVCSPMQHPERLACVQPFTLVTSMS